MKVGYARVSRIEQDTALQRDALAAAGCRKIYEDQVSGVRRGADRPGLGAALEHVRDGDSLVVWRLDRLGRSLPDLLDLVMRLDRQGVQLISLHEHIDTSTATGNLLFQLFGALAEFERNLMRERVHAGLKAARDRGRKGGRRPKVNDRMLARASELMRERTLSIKEICRLVGGSSSTLYRYLTPDGQLRAEAPSVAEGPRKS